MFVSPVVADGGSVPDPLTLSNFLVLDDNGSPVPGTGLIRLANSSPLLSTIDLNGFDLNVLHYQVADVGGFVDGISVNEILFVSNQLQADAENIFVRIDSNRVNLQFDNWNGTTYETCILKLTDSQGNDAFLFRYEEGVDTLLQIYNGGDSLLNLLEDTTHTEFTVSFSGIPTITHNVTATDATFQLRAAGGAFYFGADNDGTNTIVFMIDLPAADPGNPGQLYHTADAVRVSL